MVMQVWPICLGGCWQNSSPVAQTCDNTAFVMFMQLLEQEKKKAYAAELQAQMQERQAQKQQERLHRFGAPTGVQQQQMCCEAAACRLCCHTPLQHSTDQDASVHGMPLDEDAVQQVSKPGHAVKFSLGLMCGCEQKQHARTVFCQPMQVHKPCQQQPQAGQTFHQLLITLPLARQQSQHHLSAVLTFSKA